MQTGGPISLATPMRFAADPPAQADVVVIGGGIAGVATALYLAEAGRRVVLCEKGRIAGEQSSRNWGWVRQQGRDPAELPVMIHALRLWDGLQQRLGEAVGLRRTGTTYLANGPADLANFESWLPHARAHGLDTRMLSRAELDAMLPNAAGWVGGLHTASDARAEPWTVVPAIAGLAAEAGVAAGDTDPAVDTAIAQILTRQGANGGFGLWSADSGDLWLEAYVTDFLSRARAAGHAVPDVAFRQAIDNLRNRANYATDPAAASAEDNAALAYALAVLARERAATVGDLRYYADTAAAAFSTPMAAGNLGAALASYGDQARGDRMFAQGRDLLNPAGPEPQVFRADYGTRLRDAAALLALSAEAGSQVVDRSDLATRLAQRIAEAEQAGQSLSTQESVWTVMAAHALSGDVPPATMNGVALTRPVATLPDDAAVIANPGDTPLDITLTATGKPLGDAPAGGRGYAIARSYFSIEGEPLDPASLPQGTRMVVQVKVSPQAEGGGRLIVTDPLPAGWEIDNPNLLRAGDIGALDWLDGQTGAEMTEFRADRFAAALTWTGAEPFSLAYIVRAVTPGRFRHPAASVEDMYRPEFRAWSDGGTVEVTP